MIMTNDIMFVTGLSGYKDGLKDFIDLDNIKDSVIADEMLQKPHYKDYVIRYYPAPYTDEQIQAIGKEAIECGHSVYAGSLRWLKCEDIKRLNKKVTGDAPFKSFHKWRKGNIIADLFRFFEGEWDDVLEEYWSAI